MTCVWCFDTYLIDNLACVAGRLSSSSFVRWMRGYHEVAVIFSEMLSGEGGSGGRGERLSQVPGELIERWSRRINACPSRERVRGLAPLASTGSPSCPA
jgi:hypothetical protein